MTASHFGDSFMRGLGSRIAAATVLLSCVWPLSAVADGFSCIKDGDNRKICLSLTSTPGSEVQTSTSGNSTFVEYEARLQNLTDQSTRKVELRLDLKTEPATLYPDSAHPILSISGPETGICTQSDDGRTVVCQFDKLQGTHPETLKLLVAAPEGEGSVSIAGIFGWQGRTAQAEDQVTVTDGAGVTFVPAGMPATISTGPAGVTAEEPLWSQVTIPAPAHALLASIRVSGNGPDLSQSCTAGFFQTGKVPEAVYVCRDWDPSVDSSHEPRRWVSLDVHQPGNPGTQHRYGAERPLPFSMAWHGSIVPMAQLEPVQGNFGTPPFAIFYSLDGETVDAFAGRCDMGAAPPCLSSVQRQGTNDTVFWTASGQVTTTNPMAPASDSALTQLLAVVDFIIGVAHAQVIEPPYNMK